jgi:hypothetical protein
MQYYSSSFERDLELSLIAFIAILGPFHPMICNFLSSSSSVAMKNFSSSSRIGFEMSRISPRPFSACDRRGTANRRSFRSASFALLLDLTNSNNAAGQNDPRASCRVVNHHDVERVAVIGFRRWHEAPVMGIGQSGEE